MYIRKPRWTAKQLNFLVENWQTLTDEEIAECLGKTLKSVRRRRERLELKKAQGRGICEAFKEKEQADPPAKTPTEH